MPGWKKTKLEESPRLVRWATIPACAFGATFLIESVKPFLPARWTVWAHVIAIAANKGQWAKIKKRVKEIAPNYAPAPIFVDRYVRPYRRWRDDITYSTLTTDNTKATLTNWSATGRAEYLALRQCYL